MILGIILSNVQKEDINSAILTINRAFSSNDNFCQTMIKYMKVKLEKFIQENHNLFNIGELISNDIIVSWYRHLPGRYSTPSSETRHSIW